VVQDSNIKLIYIRLLGEYIETWCPVYAIELSKNIFKITQIEKKYFSEKLQFNIGDVVIVGNKIFSDGSRGLEAIRRINVPVVNLLNK
jgi:hypothetical protein